jgi:hypothetical protein
MMEFVSTTLDEDFDGRTRFRLRVVNPKAPPVRHARPFRSWDHRCEWRILEFWTFSEWEQLTALDMPGVAYLIPGLGYATIREPIGEAEVEELRAECRRAAKAADAEYPYKTPWWPAPAPRDGA